MVAILFALGLAAAATMFMVGALQRVPPRGSFSGPVSTSSTAPLAGSIYYRAETNDGASLIGSVAPDGTDSRILFPPGSPTRYAELAFSPDGGRVAYVDDRPGHRGIYVADADWGNATRLTFGENDSWPSWSPDGSMLAFEGTAFDPSIGFCHPGVYADCPTAIYIMGSDGSGVRRVTNEPEQASDPVWSPDGGRLAFQASSDAAIPTAIYVSNIDGSGRTRITSSRGGSDMWPSWSPTGDTIIFGGIHREDWGVFAVNVDGTQERTILDGNSAYAVHPTWSPDGTQIAFGGDAAEGEGIYTMGPDGSGLVRIAAPPDGFFVQEIAWRPTPVGLATPMPAPGASVAGAFGAGVNGWLMYGFGSVWVDGYKGPTGPGHVTRSTRDGRAGGGHPARARG